MLMEKLGNYLFENIDEIFKPQKPKPIPNFLVKEINRAHPGNSKRPLS